MLDIKIICLGKIKDSYLQEAIQEYLKRAKPYAKLEIVEIPEEKFSSINEKEKVTKKEAEKISTRLEKEKGFLIILEEKGQESSSIEFANFLEEKNSLGEKIIFVIGGPLGVHDSLKNKANKIVSLSRLTFTHQMTRVILLEQIYRATTILSGKTYNY